MKAYYYTFGCKVNQYETENIREILNSQGWQDTEDFSDSDLCIINTCTVTAQSDSKCRQLISKIRKSNPQAVLVLAGCFPQAFQKQAEEMSDCDIIVGTNNKTEIPKLVEEYLRSGNRIIKINPHQKGEKIESMTNHGTEFKTRAYVKIQDGCDQYCSYCIIPYARGHICSKPIDDIRSEVQRLVDSGHKEIIITGINLCCYGRDLGNGTRLTDAIAAACSAKGEYRVRIGSIEPEMISDEDIIRMSVLDRLCPHFHLSLQSGCDKILRLMNRHYNTEEFALLCQKLRRHFPDCAVTTDIMVGFPQETDEDFRQSLQFVKDIGFAQAHIFPYSPRPGTAAAKMNGQVEKSIKHRRAAEMYQVCRKSEGQYLKDFVGKTVKVLFEKESSPEYHQGHTPQYILVKVRRNDPEKSLRRQMLPVKITEAYEDHCIGELL